MSLRCGRAEWRECAAPPSSNDIAAALTANPALRLSVLESCFPKTAVITSAAALERHDAELAATLARAVAAEAELAKSKLEALSLGSRETGRVVEAEAIADDMRLIERALHNGTTGRVHGEQEFECFDAAVALGRIRHLLAAAETAKEQPERESIDAMIARSSLGAPFAEPPEAELDIAIAELKQIEAVGATASAAASSEAERPKCTCPYSEKNPEAMCTSLCKCLACHPERSSASEGSERVTHTCGGVARSFDCRGCFPAPTHKEAREIAQRYIDCAFNNPGRERPRHGIPVRMDYDDDVLLTRYIEVNAERQEQSERSLAELRDLADGEHALNERLIRETQALKDELSRQLDALRNAVQEATEASPEDMPTDFDGMLKMLMLEVNCEYERAQVAEGQVSELRQRVMKLAVAAQGVLENYDQREPGRKFPWLRELNALVGRELSEASAEPTEPSQPATSTPEVPSGMGDCSVSGCGDVARTYGLCFAHARAAGRDAATIKP